MRSAVTIPFALIVSPLRRLWDLVIRHHDEGDNAVFVVRVVISLAVGGAAWIWLHRAGDAVLLALIAVSVLAGCCGGWRLAWPFVGAAAAYVGSAVVFDLLRYPTEPLAQIVAVIVGLLLLGATDPREATHV